MLAEQRLAASGRGEPPCPYAVAVLGSAGRGESLLAMDQDNALVFAEGESGGAQDRWFAELGIAHRRHPARGRRALLQGRRDGEEPAMARLARNLARARRRLDRRGRGPQDLLAVDIFFDLRGVHGDGSLADTLWREAFAAARGKADFAKQLVETAGSNQPGFGLFGGFKTERGRIDLKKAGLFGIVIGGARTRHLPPRGGAVDARPHRRHQGARPRGGA